MKVDDDVEGTSTVHGFTMIQRKLKVSRLLLCFLIYLNQVLKIRYINQNLCRFNASGSLIIFHKFRSDAFLIFRVPPKGMFRTLMI